MKLHLLKSIAAEFSEINHMIQSEQSVKDGGDGSGNFGHKGRPGKVGGSTSAPSTNNPGHERKFAMARVNMEQYEKLPSKIKMLYANAISGEEKVTTDIERSLKKNNMRMIGEKYAIKQPASVHRKIAEIRDENPVEVKTDEEAFAMMHDVMRYTGVSSARNLVSQTMKTLHGMMDDGYEIVELKNTWGSTRNPYNGINCKVVSPSGEKIEVQFHTPQSFDMKERKQHKFYEEWRDKSTTEKRKEELTQIMFNLFRENPKWRVPDNIDSLTLENVIKSYKS